MTLMGESSHPRFVRYFRDNHLWVFTVAGCLEAVVTEREARELPTNRDFERLAVERMAPLLWLSMPGHEDKPES